MKVRDNSDGRTAMRCLGGVQTKLAKTLEKLASGYAVNRAADDAAGLAISEKMRWLITGTGRAEKNSREGVQLIKIGEGALAEIHDMLNRATTLAGNSANGTYVDEVDREGLQKELDHLCGEIDRIARSTSYNSVKLFQDDGYAYESSSVSTKALTQGAKTLEQLLEGQDKGKLNIVYVERTDAVETTQKPADGSASTLAKDIDLGGGQMLSDVLKGQIIPNTVNNILSSYPAFSYLSGSSIGIGLEYFSQGASGGSTTLAYVRGQVGSSGLSDGSAITSRQDHISYTLGVNIAAIDTSDSNWRTKLEATIAHEMIHAFMDEATTSGMFGKVEGTGTSLTAGATAFPDWFIEGMAQTASGPDNWVSGALKLDAASDDAAVNAAIQSNRLASNTTAAKYGTGYLACMYLGSVIAGGGTPAGTVDAATISSGLTKLMNEVIGGKSLNDAVSSLTNGKFTSISDFQSKFDSGANSAEVGQFVRELLTATGSGLGGLVSGDLMATDLTADTDVSGVKLFQLDPNNSSIKNIYPDGYKVYSGGTTDAGNVPPTGFTPAGQTKDYGNFLISGALDSDIVYDASTGELTVKAGNNIKITMKDPADRDPTVTNTLTLDGVGKVILSGMDLSASDALTIKKDVEITYEGENTLGGTSLESGVKAVFNGSGQFKTDTFTSDGTNEVTLRGGAVVVGGGAGSIDAGKVVVDKAAVAAELTNPPAGLAKAEIPWSDLGNLSGDIASIRFGSATSKMALDNGLAANLWLDPSSRHRITFTDAAGNTKALTAVYNPTDSKFEWNLPARPFTVNGGTEGVDYEYGDDGNTLIIKTSTSLEISGGSNPDEDGHKLQGRIRVNNGIVGPVNLTLTNCDVNVTDGCAFDLGAGNMVTLTLTDDTASSFTSGDGYAGIYVGEDSALTIAGNTGVLNATGKASGAGIGSNATGSTGPQTSSITITGGVINATGLSGGKNRVGGAGIGAGTHSAFGNIVITGGTVYAEGGTGGAGIGGAGDDRSGPFGDVGNITISGGTIKAHSAGHGAGIGGGWGLGVKPRPDTAYSGDILISGGEIHASSEMHGTGIGAGCLAVGGNVTITGEAHIVEAKGGDSGAGIGSSSSGKCLDIEISGKATIDLAQGGAGGAGIGSGGHSIAGKITIDTSGSITAHGGTNGVGIGSGYYNSSCTDIEIKQGTIEATGGTDSTGIGAGRGSISGNIAIGDAANPGSKIVITAEGGMTYDGGNIMSYTDRDHKNPGTLTVVGTNTTVRPGTSGEGLYSTSGAVDGNGNSLYSYPLYLFNKKKDAAPLDADVDIGTAAIPYLPLPDGSTVTLISATDADGNTKTWSGGVSHEPQDENHVFLWMTGKDQKVTISYTDSSGTSQTVAFDLVFHDDAGVFRLPSQPDPPPAKEPEYTTKPAPIIPGPEHPDEPVSVEQQRGKGGIILQVGANYGETMEVPRFYLSARALGLGNLDISTQDNALASMPIIRKAINRVSDIRGTYGSLMNRLEYNQRNLNQTVENLSDAESRIRDTDMAKEYTDYVALNIKNQAAQAMLAQTNQNASRILDLLQ